MGLERVVSKALSIDCRLVPQKPMNNQIGGVHGLVYSVGYVVSNTLEGESSFFSGGPWVSISARLEELGVKAAAML